MRLHFAVGLDHSRPCEQTLPLSMSYHLALPVAAVLAASWLLMRQGGDVWIADHIYALEGGHWALKRHFVTRQLIHDLGRSLSLLAGAFTAFLCIAAHLYQNGRAWRRPLRFLLFSVLLSTTLVSVLKGMTDIHCPWELTRYGGRLPFLGLSETRPAGIPSGRCFPAGHASAGYAWTALYFFALAVHPHWRWRGLALGLSTGAVFGIAQQLRGAHFLSHDLWSLLICWLVALGLFLSMFARRSAHNGERRPSRSNPTPLEQTGERA